MIEKKHFPILILAGVFFGIDMAIWNWSIMFTSVAHATLLANTAPIFVTLISYFYLRNKIESSLSLQEVPSPLQTPHLSIDANQNLQGINLINS